MTVPEKVKRVNMRTLITTSDAARILGLTPGRVRQLVNEEKIPSTPTAYGSLFDPEDVKRYKAQREARTRH